MFILHNKVCFYMNHVCIPLRFSAYPYTCVFVQTWCSSQLESDVINLIIWLKKFSNSVPCHSRKMSKHASKWQKIKKKVKPQTQRNKTIQLWGYFKELSNLQSNSFKCVTVGYQNQICNCIKSESKLRPKAAKLI